MDTEKTDRIIYEKVKKLLSWKSIKEFFIFMLLVSVSLIALDEAQKHIINYTYTKTCVSAIEACNGTYAVSCSLIHHNLSHPVNYSSLSPNSSLNVSSSS